MIRYNNLVLMVVIMLFVGVLSASADVSSQLVVRSPEPSLVPVMRALPPEPVGDNISVKGKEFELVLSVVVMPSLFVAVVMGSVLLSTRKRSQKKSRR